MTYEKASDSRRSIKIFGERNTGTNYLEKIARLNLDCEVLPGNLPKAIRLVAKGIKQVIPPLGEVRVDERFRDWVFSMLTQNLGWKHRLLPIDEEDCDLSSSVGYVMAVRHPLSWLGSMYRRPYSLGLSARVASMADFLSVECRTVAREKAKILRYPNPMEIWNSKTAAVLGFSEIRNAVVVRHEDLVMDPENELRRIASQLNLGLKREFRNFNESTKPEDRDSSRIKMELRSLSWFTGYSQQELELVKKSVRADLMEMLSYRFHEPFF